MSVFFSKLIDFLFQNEYSSLAYLVLGSLLGWAASNAFQGERTKTWKEQNEMKEERIKMLEAKMQFKDEHVKTLERKIEDLSENNGVDNQNSSNTMGDCPLLSVIHLTPLEVSAILKIYKFETENSSKVNQEYSFKDLMTDLNISYSEANAVIDKFRRFGLFSSPLDSVWQFPNLDRPINESKPGRLTQEGIDIAIQYQGNNQHK